MAQGGREGEELVSKREAVSWPWRACPVAGGMFILTLARSPVQREQAEGVGKEQGPFMMVPLNLGVHSGKTWWFAQEGSGLASGDGSEYSGHMCP